MGKHTPGPWTCKREGRLLRGTGTILIWSEGDKTVAEIPVSIHGIPFSHEQEIANALMIAAAPDLLEACKAFAKWFDGWCPNSQCCANSGLPIHEQSLAAIAKAESPCVS
jgi:hypothetical protein